ncbi:FtsX-like permease family protein [Cryptosporangium phraense]|uniref:FtsX-like permease family protein n=1 Tax=Cryptosporangium phraense TaxID=2593070 RepID=A0A545ALY1_9ACTN|nr:FtsX-like permease family protein [Cryptosporangium phraense]TQS42327.1 FtsX-like permease family protein [Cryptosporangium phraense]
MIGFGLRLAVTGGREAITRLVLIATATALGVGMLLAVVAGINAVTTQNDRTAWLSVRGEDTDPSGSLWWLDRDDFFRGQEIQRVDVAVAGPGAPVPPGIDRLPAPGEYYVSPALHSLLASAPAAQLGDRFPGREAGLLGVDAVPAPDDLIVLVGRSPADLSAVDGVSRVGAISTSTPESDASAIKAILGIVAIGLLLPILIFINSATRLSAARREQRFAAMRLIGATPRQISWVAATESTVAVVLGTAVGFALYEALRAPIADVPFTGAASYPDDVSLTVGAGLVVALGVPVVAAFSSLFALRRVRISPLGVTRRVTPRAPGFWRVVPLIAGLAELAWLVGRRPSSSDSQTFAYLGGILLVMIGLIVAGPWLTMVGARALAARSSRPSTLIAARRLADDPKAAFRSVSGLVLALFVTTVAIGVITTMTADRTAEHDTGDASLMHLYVPGTAAARFSVVDELRAIPGVTEVAELRTEPGSDYTTLASCAELAGWSSLGRCPEGAAVVEVQSAVLEPGRTWPASTVGPAEFANLAAAEFFVQTDGSTAALERARTTLENGFPGFVPPPSTERDLALGFVKAMAVWRQVADVVILAGLPIAGCSLAVGVVGGLIERRRPFSLLRLSGAPLAVLRRVVALESALPLLVVSAVAVGSGLLAAHLFLRSQLDISLRAPGAEYYLVVGVGLAVGLALVASTLPLLRRITGPSAARND